MGEFATLMTVYLHPENKQAWYMEISFLQNFRHWLQHKLWKWQLLLQLVMRIQKDEDISVYEPNSAIMLCMSGMMTETQQLMG